MVGYGVLVKEVRRMISKERDELRTIRIEIAVGICVKFPNLYPKIFGQSRAPISDYESSVAEILAMLVKCEPCLKKILDFYYKRQVR